MTIDAAGHAPWIESPDAVFGAIDTFIGGAWPDAAERVSRKRCSGPFRGASREPTAAELELLRAELRSFLATLDSDNSL